MRLMSEDEAKLVISDAYNQVGAEKGLIPMVCPICKRQLFHFEGLVYHHWGDSKLNAIRLGGYRRMCRSCNSALGRIFKGNYPADWGEQYKALCDEIRKYPIQYSSFDGEEGNWSRISGEELEKVRGALKREVRRGKIVKWVRTVWYRKMKQFWALCVKW